ncbi:MAG TPA: hypothetical protein PLR71_09365 [Deltaproteobacteria bacterium]|nr:hypothetical protein [Deltaproteobacteria bacterium]HQI81755.1 hypothetical protein [Deltaproteobacteria bacterium]
MGRVSPSFEGCGGGRYSEIGNDFSPFLHYGGGIRFMLSEHVVIRAEYMLTDVSCEYEIGQVEYCEFVGGGTSLGVIPL